jgi:Lon protease-like protein
MSRTTTLLPLFPLTTVLCPGVALPLHIFEERYRVMIGRCLESGEPFGVVLLLEAREVGRLGGRIARVGTTAVIRDAGRYPDGRLDIVTVGERRFRIDEVDPEAEPYLVGRVTMLDEPLGDDGEAAARERAWRVGRSFLRYLELLQPAVSADDPEIGVQLELGAEQDAPSGPSLCAGAQRDARETADHPETVGHRSGALGDRARADLLMSAARRLVSTGDPTLLSYLVTALVQVDLSARQRLLEERDTIARLARLEALLAREIELLAGDLRPLVVDPSSAGTRRN